jgi:outer membrane biosynthesis protein TonB
LSKVSSSAPKLGAWVSSVTGEGSYYACCQKGKSMLNKQIHRSLLAIITIATLWSMAALSPATELHPMVVVGIPANDVTLRHPTPEYPRVALNLHISGDVVVTVRVENGKIIETTTTSHSSILADSASHWVDYQWKFKPTVSGVFRIPISYKQSA